MSQASNYLETALLNHVFRNTALTSPATVYLALYTTNPGDDDTGTEVSGGSYSRQAIGFDAPSGGAIVNSSDVNFTSMPGTTVSHWGVRDASSGGNLLAYGSYSTPVDVTAGETFTQQAGTLTITQS